ncbi:Sulfite oxidase, mitochondrial [Halotydeus destructor]|nr:Sulfite oxidase, mitochondrial [Halotydeus destructor]
MRLLYNSLKSSHVHNVSRSCWLKKQLIISPNSPFVLVRALATGVDSSRKDNRQGRWGVFGLIAATSAITAYKLRQRAVYAKQLEDDELQSYGRERKGLATYSSEEVSKHDSKEKRVWCTFRSGVYDITDFIAVHPGSSKIMMAAGGSLEPFWELYALHKRADVLDILEKHRIGNLLVEDRVAGDTSKGPFSNEPARHPALRARSQKPYNAEPPAEVLVEKFVTPNELFYTRNHLPVPDVNLAEYQLEIEGFGIPKDITLTLDDLKRLPQHKIMATLQCAGNRRSEMNKVREVKGLAWDKAAISNAEWTGVRLLDLLKLYKVDIDDPRIEHVQFEGLDLDPGAAPYGASVPAEKALDARSDILIAYEMNGEPLSRDHGFPVRVIVPGVTAARSVKWLSKIVLSDKESDSHWQQNDYKGFSPNIDQTNVDFSSMPAIMETPVQSAICDPVNLETVQLDKDGRLRVRGYAYSGGGHKITRVDISPDGGKTWTNAKLVQEDKSLYRTWSWTLWEVHLPVDSKLSQVNLVCKAVDSAYGTQPDDFKGVWNFRGVLSNAWHRIQVNVAR